MEMRGQPYDPAALPQGPTQQEAGWAPEPVSMFCGREKFLARQDLNHRSSSL